MDTPLLENPYPDIVEPAPEPVPTELEGFELAVPQVEAPRINVPTVDRPTGGGSGAGGRTIAPLRAGLVLYYVVLVHAVVVLMSLGGLFVASRGRRMLGGKLLAAGAVLAIYTIYRYRHPPRLPP